MTRKSFTGKDVTISFDPEVCQHSVALLDVERPASSGGRPLRRQPRQPAAGAVQRGHAAVVKAHAYHSVSLVVLLGLVGLAVVALTRAPSVPRHLHLTPTWFPAGFQAKPSGYNTYSWRPTGTTKVYPEVEDEYWAGPGVPFTNLSLQVIKGIELAQEFANTPLYPHIQINGFATTVITAPATSWAPQNLVNLFIQEGNFTVSVGGQGVPLAVVERFARGLKEN
jgi:hypothetical protein